MKFITEYDLKTQYKQKSFKEFILKKEMRLTPEAKQFLTDRKIPIHFFEEKQEILALEKKQQDVSVNPLVLALWDKALSFFLLSFSILLDCDTELAEQVLMWQKRLSKIKGMYEGVETVSFDHEELDDEVEEKEISSFHIQLSKGREIAILNCLLAHVKEMMTVLEGDVCETSTRRATNQEIINAIHKIKKAIIIAIAQITKGEKTDGSNYK